MKSHPCPHPAIGRSAFARQAAPLRRRLGEAAGWLASGGTLLLIPKCPACLAAYVALLTGASLSLATAAYLRTAAIILCAATLLALALRRVALKARGCAMRKGSAPQPAGCRH